MLGGVFSYKVSLTREMRVLTGSGRRAALSALRALCVSVCVDMRAVRVCGVACVDMPMRMRRKQIIFPTAYNYAPKHRRQASVSRGHHTS